MELSIIQVLISIKMIFIPIKFYKFLGEIDNLLNKKIQITFIVNY